MSSFSRRAQSLLLTAINSFTIAFANIAAILIFSYLFSLLFDGKNETRIILSLIFVGLSFFAETLTIALFCLVQNKSLTSEFAPADVSFLAITSKIILLVIIRIIMTVCPSKYFKKKGENYIWSIMLPLFAILNMHFLIYTHRFHSHEGSIIFIIQIIVSLILCWSFIQVMIAYDGILQKKDIEAKLIVAEKMDKVQEVILKENQYNMEQIKRTIHDFHNQLVHLKELCTTSNPAAEDYYNQLFEKIRLQGMQELVEVRNAIVASCIYRAQMQCKDSGISLSLRIDDCDLSFLEFLDASSLFDNIIDNAIFACQLIPDGKERYIELSIIRNDLYLLIKVQNSKVNPIIESGHCLQSTKADPSAHGMGFTNIRDIARKYDGEALYQYTDDEFIITVSLRHAH